MVETVETVRQRYEDNFYDFHPEHIEPLLAAIEAPVAQGWMLTVFEEDGQWLVEIRKDNRLLFQQVFDSEEAAVSWAIPALVH